VNFGKIVGWLRLCLYSSHWCRRHWRRL